MSKPKRILPPLTEEQQKLVADNLPLVYWVVQHKSMAWTRELLLTLDDAVAWGNIGLCKAAILFDKSRGIKFGTFAVYCILTAINSESRRATHRKWKQCLTNINFNSELAAQRDTRFGVDPTKRIEEIDQVDALVRIAKTQTVEAMRYFLDHECPLAEVGRKIGKGRERVRQMFKLLKKKAASKGIDF